ncbi:hypothetical protein ABW19_dt0200865 [Dactylella cylindrospora]|nr:hypothetical protein ABW19_dt0200865 [Dactylella cylindrospora]
MESRLPTHNRQDSFSPSLNSPDSDSFAGPGSLSSHAGSTFSLIHRPESDFGSRSGSPPPLQYAQYAQQQPQQYSTTIHKHPGHQRTLSGTFSSPPTSPRVPVIKSMRSSAEKKKSHTPRGSVDDGYKSGKIHMIRGKWFYARLRTILYMFNWVAAASTFALVTFVWASDYLPFAHTVSTDRAYLRGTWQELTPEDIEAGARGMHIRAWPEDIDLTGVYLILAICGSGTLVFFGLWLQNIFRSAKSYYILFTRTEYFTLALLIIYGCAFGATAGYVTHVFKVDNDERDFWSWTCSRTGRGQDIVFKRQIYYDGDCDMLTGSWITLLALCGFALLALLTFPANIVYHSLTKNQGYSRFEQKIGIQASHEDKMEERAALRPKQPWKMPRWAKQGKF